MWKNFFFFSKGERNGIYVLYCLIGLMMAVNFCIPTHPRSDSIVAQEVAHIRDTLFIHDTLYRYQKPAGQGGSRAIPPTKKEERVSKPQFDYDTVRVELNSADTTELKRLRGIGSVLSNRIVKYRDKIGGFTSVEQLKKIYGLSEETYVKIEPHIWIKEVTLQQK